LVRLLRLLEVTGIGRRQNRVKNNTSTRTVHPGTRHTNVS
jgi:hypothetical protein